MSSTIISFVQFECKLTNLSAPNGSEITEEMVQKENTIQRMVPLHISFSIKSCLPLLANTVRLLGIVSYVQLHLFYSPFLSYYLYKLSIVQLIHFFENYEDILDWDEMNNNLPIKSNEKSFPFNDFLLSNRIFRNE